MGYQNSSWDICDLTKKVTGSKKFLGFRPGACKVCPPENLNISKFGFFLLCTKIRGPKSRIGFTYGLQLQNICSHGPNKKDFRSFAQKMTELEQFLFSAENFYELFNIAAFCSFLDCSLLYWQMLNCSALNYSPFNCNVFVPRWGIDYRTALKNRKIDPIR